MEASTSIAEPGAPTMAVARPAPGEWGWLAVLLTGLFLLQLATYRLYPVAWCDEVSFSEPAINFVKHGTFTTTVWQHQPPDTFPTINCPLYSMCLAPWLAVTGTSLLSVRSFNFAAMTLAAFLIWVISWRYALVRGAVWRFLLVVLLFGGYGMSFAYRCSRPDVLALVLLALLALSQALRAGWRRNSAVVLIGAAILWVGLQVALYAALLAFIAWAALRVIRFGQMVLLGTGFIVGAGSLALFLKHHGVLQFLIPIVTGMSGKHYAHGQHLSPVGALLKIAKQTLFAYPDDFSTVFLVGALLCTLPFAWRILDPARRRWVVVSVLLVAAVPAVFNVVGHYAFYYSYMLFVPAALSAAVVASAVFESGAATGWWTRWILAGGFAAAILVGLPLRLGLTAVFARFESTPRLREIVATQLRADDVVFSDYLVFFEVKRVVRRVYDPWSSAETMPFHIPGRSFTPEEKARVSALVIRPGQLAQWAGIFGGNWVPVGPEFGDQNDRDAMLRVPVLGAWLARHFSQPQTDRYPVQIFRRAEAPKM